MWSPDLPTGPHVALSVALVVDPKTPEMTGVTCSFPLEALQDKKLFMEISEQMFNRVRANYLPLSAEEILDRLDRGGFKVRKLV